MTGSENKNIIDFDKAKKRQQSRKKKRSSSLSGLAGKLKDKARLLEIFRWVQFIVFLGLTAWVLRSCGLF